MKLTDICLLRRIINPSYHPFNVIPKPSVWLRRERLRRFVAWQYASKRTTVRAGSRMWSKILIYMDMQRKEEKNFEKFYAEERLSSALAEHDYEYKTLRNMLDNSHVLLDNVILSQLAIYEPRSFESIVNLTKALALRDGRDVMPTPLLDNVEVTDDLSQAPFPRPVRFQKGPAANHQVKPRKLRYDEF